MIQVIRRTPQPPRRNKGQQFAEAFSNLAQRTAGHLYTKAEQEKKDKALTDFVGFNVSGLDEDTKKEAVKQVAKTKARQQYFGGNDPLAQPQRGTFSAQLESAPLDVQTGETPASEYAGETQAQKIKRLGNEVENFKYEDEDDYERPKQKRPKTIPLPPPFKAPYSDEQINKAMAWNVQEGRALEDRNAHARSAYDAEVKRIQSQNQHQENLSFKEKEFQRKKELDIQAQKNLRRAEVLPLKKEYADKAKIAKDSIRNKEELMDLIETGNLDDPTFAAIAEILPFNLGKRLLSPETVVYKSGLIEEFGDLKNIFKGATRVKEVEIFENKLADIYLNDAQKKAILKSRINSERVNIIKAEAAAQLEGRDDLGYLAFQEEVEKIAKPKLDALFNQIIDEHGSVIKDAENRKKLQLDASLPDDFEIIKQLMQEADGNKDRAREIAKKKGYKL